MTKTTSIEIFEKTHLYRKYLRLKIKGELIYETITKKKAITAAITLVLIVGVFFVVMFASGFTFATDAASFDGAGATPYGSDLMTAANGTASISTSSGSGSIYRSSKNNISATSGSYSVGYGSYTYRYSEVSYGSTKQVTINFKLSLSSIIADYWYRVSLPSNLGCTLDNSNVLVTYNKSNTTNYPPKEFIATMSSSYVYVTSDDSDSGTSNDNTLSVTVISIQ